LKIKCRVLPAALLLLFGGAPGFAAEKSAASMELNDLVVRIQTSIDKGRTTKADLASELLEFDELLKKHAGKQTDDVAEILVVEARLYLQVLDDTAHARQLILRLKCDFPGTTPGRKVPELLATITRHEEAQRTRSFLVINSTFPDFSEKDTLRNRLSLSAYRGRVVLVQFWATWSKSSVADVPQLLAVYDRHRAGGFEIIGISLDDDQLRLSAFTTRNTIPWPQFCDGSTWNNKLALKYGVDALPANYLLDREGKIIGKNLRGAELEEKVAAALAKQ
jgi:peroxiredoxin